MRIEIVQGKKEYRTSRKQTVLALNGIDLQIEQGEYISLCGVSGSGKTTLLNVIGCLDTLTSGKCLLNGKDTREMTDKELSKIRNRSMGFVLQDYGLIQSRTVIENVMVPLYFSSMSLSKFNTCVEEKMKKIGIYDLKKRRVRDLSGGQKQRVAIARALVNEPDIILADEPTGALDSETKRVMIRLFNEINASGKTVIVVTHDSELADAAKRKLSIKDGQIYEVE